VSLLIDHPVLLLVVSFLSLCLCAWAGASIRGGELTRAQAAQELTTILSAALTLLGLIIGFSFSMAISRYDLRKEYEESEASAIQTEYLRADLLPPADGARIRALLKSYLAQRIAFFTTRDSEELLEIRQQTTRLQDQLWTTLVPAAAAQPDTIRTLIVSGMNQVFDFEGHTQAAWWNRIPTAAWTLMGLIAILCNVLLGFSAPHLRGRFVLVVLPLLISIAFFLIADIDSPRGGGTIHIAPRNLLSLSETLHR
jgi:hypothetical protein